MPIPPNSVLVASARWLLLLESDTLERSRALLHSIKEFRDLTPTQYEVALNWLIDHSIIDKFGELRFHGNRDEMLFEVAIKEAIWFDDGTQLLNQDYDLPLDAEAAAQCLGIALDRAHEIVWTSWVKFDASERQRIGLEGELLLFKLLEKQAGVSVSHVSLKTDILGYDIVARYDDKRFNLEVKSTTKTNRVCFFLSRNEFDVSLRDKNWRLVIVLLKLGRISGLFEVSKSLINSRVPKDVHGKSKWQSVLIEVESDSLLRPLPEILGKASAIYESADFVDFI